MHFNFTPNQFVLPLLSVLVWTNPETHRVLRPGRQEPLDQPISLPARYGPLPFSYPFIDPPNPWVTNISPPMGGAEKTFLQQGAWPGFEDACKTRSHHDFRQPVPLPAKERPNLGTNPFLSVLPSPCAASYQGNASLRITTFKSLHFF